MVVDHGGPGAGGGAVAETVWLTWDRGQLLRESFWVPTLTAAIGVGLLPVVPGLGFALLFLAAPQVVVSSATYWSRSRQGVELTAERCVIHRGGLRDRTREMRWSDISAITVDGAIVLETSTGTCSLPSPRGKTARRPRVAGDVFFDDSELDEKVRTLGEWWTRAR